MMRLDGRSSLCSRLHLLLRSLPFDFVKTRMQKMERGPDGKYPYAGPVDCALQTIKNEVDPKTLLCRRLML